MSPKVVQPTFWTWVKAVFSRSFISWHRHEGWLAFLSYVAILVLAATNFRVIDEDLLGKRVQDLLSLAAIVLLFVNLLIFTPFILWKETSEERNELLDLTDYENCLDTLAEYLEEGNKGILNASVASDTDFGAWVGKKKAWMDKVEEFLEKNFGLQESKHFKHLVLLEWKIDRGYNEHHIKHKNIMAQKLLAIKEILLRHGERLSKWRRKTG
jgi:hypothetical protein